MRVMAAWPARAGSTCDCGGTACALLVCMNIIGLILTPELASHLAWASDDGEEPLRVTQIGCAVEVTASCGGAISDSERKDVLAIVEAHRADCVEVAS